MQFSTLSITIALFIASAGGAAVGGSQQVVRQNILTEEVTLARSQKPAYGGAPISNFPCPKTYLFSCQPNLAPVACASGGHAGAYSSPIPAYTLPLTNNGAPVRSWNSRYC